MPNYSFWCDVCDTNTDVIMTITEYRPQNCPNCHKLMYREYKNQIRSFTPFTDIHTTGKEVEITSPQHRDRFCAEHNITYDKAKYLKKPTYKPAAHEVTYGEVKSKIESGDFERPNSEKFDGPTKIIGKDS